MYRNVVTEMSPHRNGQTEKSCSGYNRLLSYVNAQSFML